MTDYVLTEWWSARLRDDGSFEPGERLSATGIEPSPSIIESYGVEMSIESARAIFIDRGRMKKGEPMFLIHAKYQFIEGDE